MTLSTNAVPDFQRDQILTAAIRSCGLLPDGPSASPMAEQLANAAVHLNMTLESLQAEGEVMTTTERTTQALTSGTYEYTLGTDTLDVKLGENDTIGTVYESGEPECPVKTMSQAQWLELGDKTITGTPTRCYVEKAASVKLVFWPIPDSSTATFRFLRTRFLKAGDTGAVTMELKRTWSLYLMYSVAIGVALDHSKPELANMFKGWAEKERSRCKAGDAQHGSIRFRVGHSGRNW